VRPSLQVTPQVPAAEGKLKIQITTSKLTSAKIPVGFVKFVTTSQDEAALGRTRRRSHKPRWPSYD